MDKIDWIKIRKILSKEWLILLVLVIVTVVGILIALFWNNQIDDERRILVQKISAYDLYNVIVYKGLSAEINQFNGDYISEKEFTRKILNDTSYAHRFWNFAGGEKVFGSWKSFNLAFNKSDANYKEYLQLEEELSIVEDRELSEDIIDAFVIGLLIIVYPLRFTILITRKAIKTIKSN